jgi:F-type H+-transporting ATPase subunit b
MEILHQLGITWQLLVTQIIGFLILMVVLHRVFTTKIFSILDERRNSIQAGYDQLDAQRAAMEEARRDYEQRLANIEEQARQQIQAAIKDGQELRDNIVSDARKQSESIIEQGRNDIQRERQQAFIEMRQQIVSLAISAAGKVVGESLNDARQTKLVDDFIGSVGMGGVSESGRGAHSYASGNGKGAE